MPEPAARHLPDTSTALTPTTITPAPPVPADERDSMVWVPGPGNDFIAVPRSTIPAHFFAPPAPVPAAPQVPAVRAGIDPRAQVLAAGGIAAAGAGWGLGQLVSAVAGLGTAGLAAAALLLLAARMPRPTGSGTDMAAASHGGGDHAEIHIHKGGRVKARHVHIR